MKPNKIMALKLLAVFLILQSSFIQLNAQKKSAHAVRTSSPAIIDGLLLEDFWANCPVASGFFQYEPHNGAKASQETQLRFAYDDNALYVSILMFDNAPDSIIKQLSIRDDDDVNADFVTLDLMTFNDGLYAVSFKISSAGVQSDEKYSPSGTDKDWNEVWESAVNINEKGWHAELKIPYSALRFPKKREQIWGLNVWRHVRRTREWSTWTFVNKDQDNAFMQSGELKGINDITPPLRLSLNPYVSSYLFNAAGSRKFDYSFKGGLDLKLGLNESFTLDATLIPDFGQVQSDENVLNLSPYETYYGEKRPFFTEGTELFNKCNIFYSRRIGATPNKYSAANDSLKNGEFIKFNPAETRLINATKLTGRTKNGFGIGIFNAMTSEAKAIISDSLGNEREITVQPFTNYNMIVLDRTLPNNSYVSFVNTNMTYGGLKHSADVSGIDFKLLDKANKWSVSGRALLSQHYYENEKPLFGQSYSVSAGKVKGSLQYYTSHSLMTNTYNHRDMGYMAYNNVISNDIVIEHRIYKPFGKFLNLKNSFSISVNTLYFPRNYMNFELYLNSWTTTIKHLSLGLNTVFSPFVSNDFFEARIPGRFYLKDKYLSMNGWFSSDYRKTLALDGGIGFHEGFGSNEEKVFSWRISPIVRPSGRIKLVYNLNCNRATNRKGFTSYSPETQEVFFGNRNQTDITNSLSASYIFSNISSVSLRTRHYWSQALYNNYYLLESTGGTLSRIMYDHDFSSDVYFNNFTIDLMFSWQFAPGSEFSAVWKNAILKQSGEYHHSYWNNLINTFDDYPSNSLSIKILYYIDSSKLKRLKGSKSER